MGKTWHQEMTDKHGEDPHILFPDERTSGDDPRDPKTQDGRR